MGGVCVHQGRCVCAPGEVCVCVCTREVCVHHGRCVCAPGEVCVCTRGGVCAYRGRCVCSGGVCTSCAVGTHAHQRHTFAYCTHTLGYEDNHKHLTHTPGALVVT